ncbi:MAG: multidrug transporter ATP-binding protein [Verrucomicrobiales bacterium]|nr:multidrug transporter ATP-binding protein [Verrucomicrobiales bacterium]
MSQHDDILVEEQFEQKKISKRTFRRLFAYTLPYKRIVWLNLFLTIGSVISQLLGPKLIQYGIDHFLSGASNLSEARKGILLVSAIYLLNLLVGWFLSVVQVKSAIKVGQGAMNDIRLRVFEHIQKLSLNYFDKTHQGRIISRADSDVDSLDRVMTWGANQLLASLLTLVGVLAVLLRYDWRLCLAVTVILPPLAIGTRLFHIHATAAYRRTRMETSRMIAALAESIAGVKVIQAFAREEENLSRYREINRVVSDRAVHAAKIFHTYMPFLGIMSGLGTVIILSYGSYLVNRHELTVGELAAFILYLGMFFGPIQTMGDLYNSVLSAGASAERIFGLLDTVPQVQNRPTARNISRPRGEVEFTHVFFRYDTTPDDRWILDDICLKAAPGDMIALVGATGSGKTSIINLLARFYEPQSGIIKLDGKDLQQITTHSLHSHIAIVTQENFLFTGTVMENLKFGRPQASDEEVIQAAKTLGTHDVIQRLEEGYATKVRERGANFSAGQRQLITFTRAMVADPAILILDEATSAVDPGTEALLQGALEKLFARRTSFVIAHRLTTVQHANEILVMGRGRILERGTHSELLSRKGYYADLHAVFMQSHD